MDYSLAFQCFSLGFVAAFFGCFLVGFFGHFIGRWFDVSIDDD